MTVATSEEACIARPRDVPIRPADAEADTAVQHPAALEDTPPYLSGAARGRLQDQPPAPSPLDAAVEYARRGLAVIPLVPRGKHPMLKDWPNAATTSPDGARALMMRHPGANVGIALGRKSGGRFVVDVDKKNGKNGFASLELFEDVHGGVLPRDMIQFTPNDGMHIWMRLPPEYGDWILTGGNDRLGPGLDIKAEGGQVVVAPSTTANGEYVFEPGRGPLDDKDVPLAPPWLIDLFIRNGWLRQETPPAPPPVPVAGRGIEPAGNVEHLWPCTPFSIAELREALTYIRDWDDHDVWTKIGMALKATRWGAPAFALWVEWAQHGEKFNRKRAGSNELAADGLAIHRAKWEKDFKRAPHEAAPVVQPPTIFWLAKKHGYPGRPSPAVEALRGVGERSLGEVRPTAPQNPASNDAVFDEVKLAAAAAQVNAPELPNILLSPPGILKEIAAHIRDNFMVHTVPIFAVAGALALVSIGMARIFRTRGYLYPNLYMILSGVSTGGKDAPLQAVRRVLADVGLGQRVASKPGSGPGFHQQLVDEPASIFLIDEFGYVMEGITDKRAPAYKKAIYEEILKAFTSANNAHYLGDALARERRLTRDDVARVVSHPAPVILAATTPGTLWDNLSSADALSGLLGRCLVLEHKGKPPGKTMAETESFDQKTPACVREWFRRITACGVERESPPGTEPDNLVGIMPGTRIVPTDAGSRALFDCFGREAEDIFNKAESKTAKTFAPGGVVWGRAKELAIRISIICAGAVDPIAPRVTTAEAEWAIALARYCLETMEFIANTTLFNSAAHKNKHLTYQEVLRGGARGLSKGDVYNTNPGNPLKDLSKRDKEDAIAELELAGLIEYRVVMRDRYGRIRREAWVATELLKKDEEPQDASSTA